MGLADPAHFRPTPQFRTARRRIMARIRLLDGAGTPIDVMVRDISGRGMAAAARGRTPERDEVVCALMPSGVEVWGVVRWVDRNLFGVEFEAPASEMAEAAPANGLTALAGH